MKLTAFTLMFLSLAACPSPSKGSDDASTKRAEAASGYAAQQMDCVKKYSTKEEIDSCRDKVKAAWSVDAGMEGGK